MNFHHSFLYLTLSSLFSLVLSVHLYDYDLGELGNPQITKWQKIKIKNKKWTTTFSFSFLISMNNYFDLQTKGLLSSSTTPPFAGRLLSALMDGFLCFATALPPGSLFSGNIFRMIPIAMSNNPVPCCSVNGLVNIKNDSNRVTAFLAVVICMPTSNKNPKVNFHEKRCYEILKFKCSTIFEMGVMTSGKTIKTDVCIKKKKKTEKKTHNMLHSYPV